MTVPTATRTIHIDFMSRIEGEAGLRIDVHNGGLLDLKFDIGEPPRFFEAFLCGRSLREVPDIVARICGICPVAHQLTAAQAIETALGITPGSEIRALRRLLYCAEWIESHALHIYLLQTPDFFGKESGLALAAEEPNLVRRGLALKKIGNELTTLLGGRAVHPLCVCVGGFWKTPRCSDLLAFRPQMETALQDSLDTVRFVSSLPLPAFTPDYEFVALSHPREYAITEGHIISSRGLDIGVRDFEQAFLEEHVAHSTALHSVRSDGGASYLVGPLSRLNLNFNHLSPLARQAAAETGISWPCRNPYAGIVARAVELVQACEESLRLIDDFREPESPRLECPPRSGEGCAVTEAPRGLLYHRYRVNQEGTIQSARIVPPTAQNCRRIEDDLRLLVSGMLDRPDAEIADTCEKFVRNYDPCISCSVHALRVTVNRL